MPLTFLYAEMASSDFMKYYKMIAIFLILHDISEVFSEKYAKDSFNLNMTKYKLFLKNKKIQVIIDIMILLATILSLVIT